MEIKNGLQLLSFVILLSTSLGYLHECTDHSHDWKYFVLSQWWPQSQCYYRAYQADFRGDQNFYNEYEFKNNCVPHDVEGWTIHGLWPTVNGTPSPCDCNTSWTLDIKKIEDLKSKLWKQWLSYPDTSESEKLWKHEWIKHGTCAVPFRNMTSEHDYFYKTLELNLQYNLLKMFDAEGLRPNNNNPYRVEDFEDAIKKEYNVKGRIICLEGPDGDQYLGGVRICLDKNFNPRDCLVTEPESCSRKRNLKYPVIIRQESDKSSSHFV